MIRTGIFLFSILFVCQAFAHPDDVQGSADHPMFSRYPGTIITKYDHRDYQEYNLALSSPDERTQKTGLKKTLELEGELTRFVYYLKPGTSTLKVFRNYEQAIKKAGFSELYKCKKSRCGWTPFWQTYFIPADVYGKAESQRYYAGKLTKNGKDIYMSLYAVERPSGQIYIGLDIIETKAMEKNLVSIDPRQMADKLQQEGKIALYGIYFDTDKANIRPESAATLKAIAQLLQQKPSLKLYVVGHTDDTGSLEHNRVLSTQRATSVVQELMRKHGVAEGRLLPFGAGPYAPVSTNLDDAGKAKNRRVELVQRL